MYLLSCYTGTLEILWVWFHTTAVKPHELGREFPVHVKVMFMLFIKCAIALHLRDWTSVRLYFTSAVSLNLNTNLCNWGIIRVLLTLYGRLSGFAIAMRSRKENHSEGQCREWRAVYYTGGPTAESSLAKDPDQLLWKPYIPVYCSSLHPQIP